MTWTAELFFYGEGIGWEARIFRDGELSVARTYLLRDVAVGWAKNERDRLGKDYLSWGGRVVLRRMLVDGRASFSF